MKKKLIPMLILAITGAAGLTAHAETVTSANAVGMVKITAEPGQFTLFSLPFEIEGGSITAEDLFGSVPYGTILYYWEDNRWVSETYNQGNAFVGTVDEWSTEFGVSSKEFQRGDGVFISLPENEEGFDIVIAGQVPDNSTASQTTVELFQGFSIVGLGYPVSLNLSDERLGLTPAFGDTIYIWQNGWQPSTYQEGNAFVGIDEGWEFDFEIQPGSALLYSTLEANSFTLVKDLLYSFP